MSSIDTTTYDHNAVVPNNWNLYFSTDPAGNIYIVVEFQDLNTTNYTPVIKSYTPALALRWQLFLASNISDNQYQSNLVLGTTGVGMFLNPGDGLYSFNMVTGALLNKTAPNFPGNVTAPGTNSTGTFMTGWYQPYYLHAPTNSILMADQNSGYFALYDIASDTFLWKWSTAFDNITGTTGFESGIAVSSDGKIFLQDYNGNTFAYGCPVGLGLASDGHCVSCTLLPHTQACVPPPVDAPVAAPVSPVAPSGSPSAPGGSPSSPKAPGGSPVSPKAPGASSASERAVHGLLLIAALMTSLFLIF